LGTPVVERSTTNGGGKDTGKLGVREEEGRHMEGSYCKGLRSAQGKVWNLKTVSLEKDLDSAPSREFKLPSLFKTSRPSANYPLKGGGYRKQLP